MFTLYVMSHLSLSVTTRAGREKKKKSTNTYTYSTKVVLYLSIYNVLHLLPTFEHAYLYFLLRIVSQQDRCFSLKRGEIISKMEDEKRRKKKKKTDREGAEGVSATSPTTPEQIP